MSGTQWHRIGLVSAGLVFMMACQAERLTDTAPPDPALQLDGIAVRLEVNLQDSTIRIVTPASAKAPGGNGPAYAILGTNEVGVSTANLTRTPIPGNKVRVSFDAAVVNRLTSSSLVPPTFPAGAAGSTGLLLFPYRVTQVVGAAASQVLASIDWNGDGTTGSGAPRNFFNDFGCTTSGTTSDCFRWEQYPAPLNPGETTPAQRVGFDMPKAVTSFQVLLVLAADINNDLPAPQRLVVTPASYVMSDGFPAYFSAVAYDIANNPLPWVTIHWTSPDITAVEFKYGSALVGSIAGPSVEVHGRKVGQTYITARTGGLSVQVPVDIQVNTIVLVQPVILPDSDLVVGEQVQAVASVKDNSGNIVPGFNPTWSSSDPNVATVDPVSGLITATGVGSVTITATAAAASGIIPITVTASAPPGDVSGGIVDPISGIAGVGVSASGISAVTNVNGAFLLRGVPAGSTSLTLSNLPSGCTTTSVPVVVPPGGSVSTQIDPSCTSGLHVTVSSIGVGRLGGGRVFFNSRSVQQTDQNGELLLTRLASRVVQVDAFDVPVGCMQPALYSAVPSVGGVTQVDIDVACPGPARLSGVVTATGFTQFDGSLVPAPGVTINLLRRFQSGSSAITGADGSYVIDPAPIGPGNMQVFAFGGVSAICGSVVLPIDLLGQSDVTLALTAYSCQVYTVRVKVQDLSTAPSLRTVDLRIRSALTGSVFGGALANNGSATDFPILGDNAAFQVYLDNLPPGCTSSGASGVADHFGGLTSVTLTLQCP